MRTRLNSLSCSERPLSGRRRDLPQKTAQIFADLGGAQQRDSFFPNHNDVGGGGKPGLVQAEELSNPSFQVIPLHGLADLATDDNPQAGPPFPVGTNEKQEVARRKAPSLARGSQVLPPPEQAILLGKRLIRNVPGRDVNRLAHRVFMSLLGQAILRKV